DELMLALLDEGRRRLLSTLRHRMQRSTAPADQVRAWIEGVLAQASNAAAAARTRPWVTSEQRLAELFPEEQQASVDLIIGLLDDPIMHLAGRSVRRGRAADEPDAAAHAADRAAARAAAVMVYRLTFATLRSHLADGTRPTPSDLEDLVGFCLRGATE
ncbi:MAG TPA: hypothetical protein VID75_10750, partial [Acidimicrobiales bacterium]